MDTSRTRIHSALTPKRAVVAAVLVAAVVARAIWPLRDVPFDSDEANHANIALRQFQDLADGRFVDFLRHSYRTGQFPFLHGWTVVPWFAVLGATAYAARVAQTLSLVVGVAAAAYAAYRACGDDRRAGGLAGALFALSPYLAIVSGLCMLETPGAAATAIALACLAEALRSDGRRGAWMDVLTAGAVLAAWFTKINYGMWIAPAVALGYVVPAGRHVATRRALLGLARYVAVAGGVIAAWWITPAGRAAMAGLFANPPEAVSVVRDAPEFRVPGLRWDNFAGYFPILARDYHLHWTLGAIVLAFAAWGVVRAVRDRSGAVVAAAACVAWTWATLSTGIREYPLARFIAPALPALWICAAYGAAPLLARAAKSTAALVAERVVLLAAIVAQAFLVMRGLPPEYEESDRFRPVFEHLVAKLDGPASVMVVNYADHVSARTLAWELGTRPGSSYRDWDVTGLIGERVYESERLFDAWMETPRRWGDAAWRSYVVEFEPSAEFVVEKGLVPDTLRRWHAAVARRREAGRLETVDAQPFPDLGLTVWVFRDRSPPPHLGHGAPAGR